MLEKLYFSEYVRQAWRASFSAKLPWVFGVLIALVSIAETHLTRDMPAPVSFDQLVTMFQEGRIEIWFSTALSILFLFVVHTFAKANLIPSLSFVAGKKELSNTPRTLSAMVKNFLRTFLLESLILLLLIAVLSIIAVPLWVATRYNPEAMTQLSILSFLTLMPILIIMFFIRQYALFYLLLSPLKIKSCLKVGGSLFSRFVVPSLFFGLFSLFLTFLFTFCLNLVILSFSFLTEQIALPWEESAAFIVLGLIFFSWFTVFHQALWLNFFRTIAGTHDSENTVTEKETSLVDTHLPEVPPV